MGLTLWTLIVVALLGLALAEANWRKGLRLIESRKRRRWVRMMARA